MIKWPDAADRANHPPLFQVWLKFGWVAGHIRHQTVRIHRYTLDIYIYICMYVRMSVCVCEI